MKRTLWAATCVAAAIACGRGGGARTASADRPGGGDTGSNAPSTTGTGGGGSQVGVACDGTVTVVVRGVDAGDLGAFDLDVAAPQAKVGGTAVTPDHSASGTLSLGGGATPELLAMKRSHDPVDVTLAVGRVHVCKGTSCSDLDLCTSPITFTFDVDKVVPDGCHVFLDLDLAGSVQPTSGGQAFLPRFSVKYW